MQKRASAVVFVAFLATACGRSAAPEKRVLCEALATAAAVNDALLEQATQEYAATERAMRKWEQWEAKSVTSEQDGTGEYSQAGARAWRHKEAGYASCHAARLHGWELVELSRLIDDTGVTGVLQPLDAFECRVTSPSPVAGAPKERNAFQREWQSRKSQAQLATRAGVEACFKRFGGTAPKIRVPTIFTPQE